MSENIVQYVVAASGGDTDAMAKLYSKTLKASYYLASALCADDRAVEITKEAYAKAFCSIDKLKKPEAFEIWMKQNVASVYKEKQKFVFTDAEAGSEENSSEFLPESAFEDSELSEKVLNAVASLKPELRTALVLHYNNGMPVAALAKFLGVSESTANSLLGKARAGVLAASGIESSSAPEVSGSLPVLTRIFQRSAAGITIENTDVRDIFIYAIDAYEASKPAVESEQQPVEEVQPAQAQEESAERETAPSVEDKAEAERPDNIISFKQKINDILDGENIKSSSDDTVEDAVSDEAEPDLPDINISSGANDISFKDFGGISIDADNTEAEDSQPAETPAPAPKKSFKLNAKTIGIACAALLVIVIIIVAVASKGKDNKPDVNPADASNGVTSVEDAIAQGYLWQPGGFAECTEIVYLDENCCYFKSATTGKYGLLDYQGNVILQPNYDGFERCSSGRDYSGRNSYHSLVKIGNETFEFLITNGMAVVSETPHASHSVETEKLEGTSYDERDRYFEGYAAARKNDKWGYVSQDKDKKVIPYEYEAVNDLSANEASYTDYCRGVTGGLIAVKKDGKMGIINLENDTVVPFEYDNIMPGSDGVFIAQKGGTWGVILVGETIKTFNGVNVTVQIAPPTTTEPEENTMGKYKVTSSDGANIRSGAGADYELLGELDYGDIVIGYSTERADNGKKWLQIKYNGEYGWVAMSNLEAE